MKLLRYLHYYFYLIHNWDLSVANHIIEQEITGEKKYGINTTGTDTLKHLRLKGIDTEHATIYMPLSYDLLEEIFEHIDTKAVHHFLDIGCGKGRVMCVAAHYGIKNLTGIDFSKKLCRQAEKNLDATWKQFPAIIYHVINNDAFYYGIPDDVDCIFLFNPFDEVIMSGVIEKILKSLDEKPRPLIIVYANPLYKDLFLNEGFKEIYHVKKMVYLEASILQN